MRILPKTVPGKMMSPAGGIALGAISGTDSIDDDVVLNIQKKIVCVRKVELGATKVTGVIDEKNVLDFVCSPYFKETYIGMSTRGEVQRWNEHWRNYRMSPQGHELPHCGLMTQNNVCLHL